jgi:hypothetical protein
MCQHPRLWRVKVKPFILITLRMTSILPGGICVLQHSLDRALLARLRQRTLQRSKRQCRISLHCLAPTALPGISLKTDLTADGRSGSIATRYSDIVWASETHYTTFVDGLIQPGQAHLHIFQLLRVLVDRERERATETPDSGQAAKRGSLGGLDDGSASRRRNRAPFTSVTGRNQSSPCICLSTVSGLIPCARTIQHRAQGVNGLLDGRPHLMVTGALRPFSCATAKPVGLLHAKLTATAPHARCRGNLVPSYHLEAPSRQWRPRARTQGHFWRANCRQHGLVFIGGDFFWRAARCHLLSLAARKSMKTW